jgi:hypothetical protein
MLASFEKKSVSQKIVISNEVFCLFIESVSVSWQMKFVVYLSNLGLFLGK